MGILVAALPAILNVVEGLFGPKTGPVKLESATDVLKALAEQLKKLGKLPDKPNDDTLHALIELALDQLKKSGLLTGQMPVPATPETSSAPAGVYLLRGSIIDVLALKETLK